MTQAELGEQVGRYLGRTWSRQTVSAAEKGGRAFTALELVVISVVLGVPLNVLFLPHPAAHESDLETPGGEPLPMQVLLQHVLPGPEQESIAEQYADTHQRVVEIHQELERSKQELERSKQEIERNAARDRKELLARIDALKNDLANAIPPEVMEAAVMEVMRRTQQLRGTDADPGEGKPDDGEGTDS